MGEAGHERSTEPRHRTKPICQAASSYLSWPAVEGSSHVSQVVQDFRCAGGSESLDTTVQITQCAPLWSSTARDLGLDNDVYVSVRPIRLYVPGTEAYQRIGRWAPCDWAAKPPSRSMPVHGAPAPLLMGCPQPHSRAPNSILRLAVFLSSPHFFSAFNFRTPRSFNQHRR